VSPIKTILINGLLEFDSGKTTLGLSLIHELIGRGLKVAAYKPIAGHNGWFQMKSLLNSIKHGVLVGDDAYKYYILMRKELPLELINPIDMLLAPPDLKDHRNVTYYMNAFTNITDMVVLMRISSCTEELRSAYHLISENYKHSIDSLKTLIDELIKKVRIRYKVKFIDRTTFTNLVSDSRLIDEVTRGCFSKYVNYDLTVIESYNNVVTPMRLDVIKPSIVLTVTPGKVFVYDGDRYIKAYELIHGMRLISLYSMELTHTLFKILKPDGSFNIPPCRELGELCLSDVSELTDWVLNKLGY